MTAIESLASLLREEQSVISPHVSEETAGSSSLGELAAAGPRAAADPEAYALIVEAVREGYLLHYGEPRILAGADPDLALLAGDYLYATGLSRLAALGDLAAVRELSDLISLSAHIHGGAEEPPPGLPEALWLAAAVSVGGGPADGHEAAKAAARDRDGRAADLLTASAEAAAEAAGAVKKLDEAREAIGFPSRSTNHS